MYLVFKYISVMYLVFKYNRYIQRQTLDDILEYLS